MSDLFGNHIVGFPTRWLKCNGRTCHYRGMKYNGPVVIYYDQAFDQAQASEINGECPRPQAIGVLI